MINTETASREEIVDETFRILSIVKKHQKEISSSTIAEFLEWIAGFVVRLSNDLQGIPHKTKEQEWQEIRDMAEHVQKALANLKCMEK